MAKYTACRWGTANKAIERLIEMGILEVDQERSKPKSPRYRILGHDTKAEDAIWLPNTLVEGANKTAPYPLDNLRSANDPLTIQLLMALYQHQNLIGDGGISRDLIWRDWTCEGKIGQQGGQCAWEFNAKTRTVNRAFMSQFEPAPDTTFWDRFKSLEWMGFIDHHNYLLECLDGEPMASLGNSTEELDVLRRLTTHAITKVCPSNMKQDNLEWVLPVMAHIKEPVLVGGYRLKYRPKTKRTAAWWAEVQNMNQRYLSRFGLLPQPQPELVKDADFPAFI